MPETCCTPCYISKHWTITTFNRLCWIWQAVYICSVPGQASFMNYWSVNFLTGITSNPSKRNSKYWKKWSDSRFILATSTGPMFSYSVFYAMVETVMHFNLWWSKKKKWRIGFLKQFANTIQARKWWGSASFKRESQAKPCLVQGP